jgi:hypothetical protein
LNNYESINKIEDKIKDKIEDKIKEGICLKWLIPSSVVDIIINLIQYAPK